MTRPAFAAFLLLFCSAVVLAIPQTVPAQTPTAGPPAAAATAAVQPPTDDDPARLDPAEPDYVVVNLPTTLRLPRHGGNFHLTHRFEGNLRDGSFSDQLGNLFGVDVGAAMSFEYRFGIASRLEAIASRANRGRTIEFSAKYNALHQSATRPVSVSGIISIEGDNNFGANSGTASKNYAPAIGLSISRKIAGQAAFYATPFWVGKTGTNATADGNTGFIGLGARIRFGGSNYLIGEVTPRLGGFVIGDPEYGFGIEKRVGAHVFALTFTNGTTNTTYRQLARGGSPGRLHLGFNLTRKFF